MEKNKKNDFVNFGSCEGEIDKPEEKSPTRQFKKNPLLRSVIFIAAVLLFATFVAFPYQSSFAHDSGSHEFCFDQTLNALDWMQDALFPIITVFFAPYAFIFKLILSVLIIGGGVALSLFCAPQVAPPPKAFRVYLPCNFAGFPNTSIAELNGFRVYPGTETSQVGDDLQFYSYPTKSWEFDTDDRDPNASPPNSHKRSEFPVIGSFRDSIYSESDGGSRLGFTTWYAAESVLLWIEYQIGTILALLFGLLPIPSPAPDTWVVKVGLPLLEIILGAAFAVLFAIFGNYKKLISDVDSTGGTIAHPITRKFEIRRDSDSLAKLTDDQKELLGEDFKLYPLGKNQIEYKGRGLKEDSQPAKFYFNVVDPLPPYVGLGNLNVTIVEANTHWGFKVEPKEWNKMGFSDFVKWDNCNSEPKVEYTGKQFLPMALITEDHEKFRVAQDKYDLEFEKSHNRNDAKQTYLRNVVLTEQDEDEFRGQWKATDHPEGYYIYEGGIDPSSLVNESGDVSPIDVGNETFIYDDDELTHLIELQANATNQMQNEIQQENSQDKKVQSHKIIRQAVVSSILEARDGVENFAGGRALKSILIPSTCPIIVGNNSEVDKTSTSDALICVGGLVGSGGISILQSNLDNKYQKKLTGVFVGANLDDEIKKLEDEIKVLKRSGVNGNDEIVQLDYKVGKKQAELNELVSQKEAISDAKFAVAGKAFAVGISALTTFIDPPDDSPPKTEKVSGLESFWNQTVIVIDTTPPDVLVPDFEAVEVNSLAPQELRINPPLIFDVADPSPDLYHNFTGGGKELDFDICHEESGKCGWIPLGDDDFLEGTFPVNSVTNVSWFGRDFSENESPIRDQIVNVKLAGTNLISVALNQTHLVGGFDFNPAEVTIVSQNPDNDPVKYLVESNPKEGVLKSPLDPVFQNKITETGDTASLRGLVFVSPSDINSPDFVYFPDSRNNRVMKIFTESGDSNGIGHVQLGFTFENGTEFPAGILPLDISPKAITQLDSAACPLTFLVADWDDEKIYNATLGNCDENNSTAFVTDFYDVKDLFSDPQYFEVVGDNLYVTDSNLGSIIKTTFGEITSANSLNKPTDVLSTENNKAWITDSGNSRIIEFDITTNTSQEKTFPKNLSPSGIATNSTHLFVSHESGKKITVINQTNINDSFEIPQTGNLNLGRSERIAVDGEFLYVTDSKNDQIHILNTTGFIHSIDGPEGNQTFFDNPVGISVNANNLYVADSGNNRIVRINLGNELLNEEYTNSTGNWHTFGNGVTVNGSSSTGVLKFDNVPSGSSASFSGAYADLGTSLPERSWTATFSFKTGTNTNDSSGYVWLLTNQTMVNPESEPVNALGVKLDSSKLLIYQKNSTDTLVSTNGIPIENNTKYEISLTRNPETNAKLSVSTSGPQVLPTVTLDISQNITNLHVLQHSNSLEDPIGDSLNFTIDDSIISPVKFSWMGSCSGGFDCIDSKKSNGFLCTEDTCLVDQSLGNENGQLNTPLGITNNGTNFFVTDAGNQRVQIFNTDGKFVSKFGDVTDFIYPTGISTDGQGKIYVADNLGNALKVFEGESPFNLIHEITTKRNQQEFLQVAQEFPFSIFDVRVNAVSMNPNNGHTWILGKTPSNQTKLFNLKNTSHIGNVIDGISLESLGLVAPSYFAIDSNGKFFLIDGEKNNGTAIEFELINNLPSNIQEHSLSPEIKNPVGIEIENENGQDYVYISDWIQGNEKIIKFRGNDICGDGSCTYDTIYIPNLTNDPKDIGFVNAQNPCLDDSSHCESPLDNRRITIADEDEEGPKIISFRTDMGIINNKKILDGNSIKSIDYGIDNNENTLYAIADNKTIFSYDPWSSTHKLQKYVDLSSVSLEPDSFAFNPLPFGSKGNFTDGKEELISPRGMAFSPHDGNLYVASMETDSVKKYNGTDGKFIEDFIGEDFLDRPYGLAFNPETNNLFVSNFGDGCIREFDESGEHVQDIQCERDHGMSAPKGIAFDSKGVLYASAYDQNSVIKFDLEHDENDELKLPKEFIPSESGFLDSPDGLAFDNEDNLYVVNPKEVLEFDSNGNFVKVFANNTIVSDPKGIYFDKKNEFIYISNNVDKTISDDSIKKLDLEGNLISTIKSKSIKSPYYLAMDSLGNIYTGNEIEGTIVQFGETDDDIYVAEWGDNINQRKIFAFTNNGAMINEKTINLKNIVPLPNPGEIAIDVNGNLYITDNNGTDARVVVIDRISKDLLKEIPLSNIKLDRRECTEIPGEDPPLCRYDDGEIVGLDKVNTSTIRIIPDGISINSDNEIFLSDWENERIVRLFSNGDFIDLYKFNNTFAQPEDIAISLDKKEWGTNNSTSVVIDQNKGNHKIRFSILEEITNEVKSLNYFSILQEKREFPSEIESIEGLARCIVESCEPPSTDPAINNFTRETYSMLSSPQDGVKIALTNSDKNRFINSTEGPDTISLDFSMEPEGLGTYDGKFAITDWDREAIRTYDPNSFELIDENIVDKDYFPPLATKEFSDIDFDQNRLFISDNFEVRIRQIENILEPPESNNVPKLTLDQFIWMSSIAVNDRDEIYLASQENKTVGNYDFRGNLIGDKPISIQSSIHLDLSNDVSLNFTDIVLHDMAIDYGEPSDTVYLLLKGMLELSRAYENNGNPETDTDQNEVFKINAGVILHGKYEDLINSNYDDAEWMFFQEGGTRSGYDSLCFDSLDSNFFFSFLDPTCERKVSSSPSPSLTSMALDNETKLLYFNLNSNGRIAVIDTNSPTCQVLPSITVPSFSEIFPYEPIVKVITFDHQYDNVLLCGSLADKTQATISGASINDMVLYKNQILLSDVQGHRIHLVNITNGFDQAESYHWMGKCETGNDCNKNDMTSKGFSCKMQSVSVNVFGPNGTSCDGGGFGDFNGQFRDPSELAVDRKTGDLFTTDFPINLKTGEPNPRVQKFSDKGFFIEDFISTLSRPELTNDPELLTDQSAGFFDNDSVVGIAKASNYFYAADGRKLHFFDTNPFDTAVVEKDLNLSFANVTYQYFLEQGTDSFEFKVTDGFDESDSGTVTLEILDIDCDDDGFENSIDLDFNGNGCPNDTTTPLFEDSELLGFSDGVTFGFINSTKYDSDKNLITIRDEKEPEGIFIESDADSQDSIPVIMCDGEYRIDMEAGDRVLVKCKDSEIRILRGQNVEVTFFDDEGREAQIPLSYLDKIVFVPDGPAFKSLSSVSVAPKNMTVSFNGDVYEYVDALEPETELVVDSAPPQVICPEPLTLEADVVEGIHLQKSSLNNTNAIASFVEFVHTNSSDIDNGNPNREAELVIDNNLPEILPVGETVISFNATDRIGNLASCAQIIKVKDSISPEVVLPPGNYNFTTTAHDDVFVFNFKEEIVNKATILDRYVNWTGNTPGEKAIVSDDELERRPICMPHPGTEFTVNTTPVGCEGLDQFFNAGISHFNMTVTANSSVKIEEAIAAGSSNGDTITIRFSHETNKPAAQSKEEIDSLIDTGGKSIGSEYSGFYLNPSTLVISIEDPTGSELTLDGSTLFDIKDGANLKSSSGILGSSSNPVSLTGNFEKPRSPFITDFIANDPMLDDIGDASEEEEKMVNIEYSPGDVLTIRFSDPTNKAGFEDEILNKTLVDSLFQFSPNNPGDDYTGSWLNDRTFVVTIKERNTYTNDFPLLGTTTVKVISPFLKDKDEKSETSNSESWPLQGSFGRFSTFKNVKPGFSLTTTQPSGIVTEIKFPNGGKLSSLSQIEGAIDVNANPEIASIIGNTLDIKSSDDCKSGCDVEFTFTNSDLKDKAGGDTVIIHDTDGNRIISSDEILDTHIQEISPGTYTATAKLYSLSIVALAKLSNGGGGGGDSAAPDIQDLQYSGTSGGSGGYSASGIGFNNNLEPIVAKTGKPFAITLTIYENYGLQAFQHISLYMNLRGLNDQVHESDTYIRWDKGLPVSIRDPHGYFADADVDVFEVGNKIQVVFKFNFALPMEKSDVIIRTWDNKRNSWDSNFPGLLTVTGSPFYGIPLETIDLGDVLGREVSVNATSIFPEGFLERWNAFSDGNVSDMDLLELLGLQGQKIPDWFKETSARWFMEQKISEREFIDALEYLSNNNILG